MLPHAEADHPDKITLVASISTFALRAMVRQAGGEPSDVIVAPSCIIPEHSAEALTLSGFPITAQQLANLRMRGTGPKFSRWGKRVLYRPEDLADWALSKLTAPTRFSA